MKKTIIIYNLFLASIISLVGLLNAQNTTHIILSLAFVPLVIYFTLQLMKKSPPNPHMTPANAQKSLLVPKPTPSHSTDQTILEPEILSPDKQAKAMHRMGIRDTDRRVFLKFIGTSSISLFLLALFTKRAQAAFFGSIPGPGTVNLKDSSGQTIDPAEKQPTDGYEVAEIDDTTATTYYGFVHKDGSWYITQESNTGSYRYNRGASNFATNWALRATLSYDTFDNVF